MSGTSKEKAAKGRLKLGAFDSTNEKDVAKREKIKAYNALLLKLGAVEDAPKNIASTPIRKPKETARSKGESSGKKTEVKMRLATKVTPGKNVAQPSKLSAASTQDELSKTAPTNTEKSPLRFNNVQLVEAKKPAPATAALPKRVVVRESMSKLPLKSPAPKKPSPAKPVPKATMKPPVPTRSQLRSQTPTVSTRKAAPSKTPTRSHIPSPSATAASANAYRTPVKSNRELQREQHAVKAASLTLRLVSIFAKSRFTHLSFSLNKLKLDSQHFKIKESFAEEFRNYSLKKRMFNTFIDTLNEVKKR
jgi:hypothetical protein